MGDYLWYASGVAWWASAYALFLWDGTNYDMGIKEDMDAKERFCMLVYSFVFLPIASLMGPLVACLIIWMLAQDPFFDGLVRRGPHPWRRGAR